ncbi:MAG: alkaline phosphatase family protein [Actinobacteria bacterium]|nr:alkaline phosphatase family protein [Actinomycetota bacterium]
MPRIWRTRALACAALAAVAATTATTAPVGAQTSASALHVVVLVVDGMNPDEVTALTPSLNGVRSAGTWFEDSRSVLVAETIPNHVAMMTGVLPGRSGIVANSVIAQDDQEKADDADDPGLFDPGIETLFTTFHNRCPGVQTATVLSKAYLHGIFATGGNQQAADFHWAPTPLIPVSGHTPDLFTTNAFLGWLDGVDPAKPSFSFVNLGDVDRMGHVDLAGSVTQGAAPAQRRAVLEHTDVEVGRILTALEDQDMWEETVLVVVSDHGMDWAVPTQFVETSKILEAAGFQRGTPAEGADFQIAHNGGADLVYVHDDAQVEAIGAALKNANKPGIADVVWGSGLSNLGISHRHAGDVVVFAADGWRMADATGQENAIVGNHGHGPTQHNVLMVGGGHDSVAKGVAAGPDDALLVNPRGRVGVLSVAPTVTTLFGIEPPNEPSDAPALDAAFAGGSVPEGKVCAAAATTAGAGGAASGTDVMGAAAGSPGASGGVTPATGGSLAGVAAFGTVLVLGGLARRRALTRA